MRKKRIRRILILDIILLAVVAGTFAMTELKGGLEMNGEPEITLNIGDDFEDPGVRSRFAKTSGLVDTSVQGDYTIEYTLGRKKVMRIVHVVDSSKLVLGLKGSAVQRVLKGSPYIEGGAFATDKRHGRIDPEEIVISGEVDTDTPGTYEVSYEVSSGGLKKKITRSVEVLDKSDFGKKADEVPVMMYHWIYTKNDEPESIDGNWIKNTELEKHLKYLTENDYYYPSWQELRAWLDGEIELPEKSIIVTFDDAKLAFLQHGKPLFEEYQVPVTSFMICWDKNDPDKKMRRYACEYIDFENHSYAMHQGGTAEGHRGIIANMSRKEIVADFKKAEKHILNNDAFAYPYGDYTDDALKAVSDQGFLCAFTTEGGKVTRGQDYRKLPRVRVFGDSSFDSWKASIK